MDWVLCADSGWVLRAYYATVSSGCQEMLQEEWHVWELSSELRLNGLWKAKDFIKCLITHFKSLSISSLSSLMFASCYTWNDFYIEIFNFNDETIFRKTEAEQSLLYANFHGQHLKWWNIGFNPWMEFPTLSLPCLIN